MIFSKSPLRLRSALPPFDSPKTADVAYMDGLSEQTPCCELYEGWYLPPGLAYACSRYAMSEAVMTRYRFPKATTRKGALPRLINS